MAEKRGDWPAYGYQLTLVEELKYGPFSHFLFEED
jgi:hypothetical protein